MVSMNNQGKKPQQYQDSTRFAWYGVMGMSILLSIVVILERC